MAIKPRTYVPAPAFTPKPFGLLSSLNAVIRSPSDPHWQAGVIYESICAIGNTTYDECFSVSGTGGSVAPVAPPPSKIATTEFTLRGATPFTVFVQMDCSAPGFWDRSLDSINSAFTQSEQWQVERAFWTGLAGGQPVVYPHLAANVDVWDGNVLLQSSVVTGTADVVGVVEGIGVLESALANCYDGVGVLHVPAVLGPALANATLLIREGSYYRTPSGNIIVLGDGYTGSSPDGIESPDSVYVYATGAMMIYRSPTYTINGADAFDRADNTLKPIVERNYLLGWDCCHVGVNISLGS